MIAPTLVTVLTPNAEGFRKLQTIRSDPAAQFAELVQTDLLAMPIYSPVALLAEVDVPIAPVQIRFLFDATHVPQQVAPVLKPDSTNTIEASESPILPASSLTGVPPTPPLTPSLGGVAEVPLPGRQTGRPTDKPDRAAEIADSPADPLIPEAFEPQVTFESSPLVVPVLAGNPPATPFDISVQIAPPPYPSILEIVATTEPVTLINAADPSAAESQSVNRLDRSSGLIAQRMPPTNMALPSFGAEGQNNASPETDVLEHKRPPQSANPMAEEVRSLPPVPSGTQSLPPQDGQRVSRPLPADEAVKSMIELPAPITSMSMVSAAIEAGTPVAVPSPLTTGKPPPRSVASPPAGADRARFFESVPLQGRDALQRGEGPAGLGQTPRAVAAVPDPVLLQTGSADPVIELASGDVQRPAAIGTDSVRTAQSLAEHAPRVIETIAHAARALVDRPVELALNPEELGRIRMTLQATDGGMSVQLTVERPETLELLRRNIDLLAAELRQAGYERLSFGFTGDQQAGGQPMPRPASPAAPIMETDVPIADPQHPLRLSHAEEGLDLRI